MKFFLYLIYCVTGLFADTFGTGADESYSTIDTFVGFVIVVILAGMLVSLITLADFIYKKRKKSAGSNKVKKKDFINEPININNASLTSSNEKTQNFIKPNNNDYIKK